MRWPCGGWSPPDAQDQRGCLVLYVCSNGLVEWVRHWRVTITLEDRFARTQTRSRIVKTPEQLRVLVEWCRGNPAAIRHQVESLRVLDGVQPTHCPCGARYRTRGTLGRLGWHVCHCGGHFLLPCRVCGKVAIEPALAFDCAAFKQPP